MSEIRAAAAARRVSIKELSRRIDSDYSALRRYLDGQREMSMPTLYRIAEALSMNGSDLALAGEQRAAREKAAPSSEDPLLPANIDEVAARRVDEILGVTTSKPKRTRRKA